MNIFSFLKRKIKRKTPRKKAQFQVEIFPVKVRSLWPRGSYQGTSQDISVKGIRVRTDAPVEVRDVVELRFALQKNSKVLQLTGTITNIHRESNHQEVGIRFSRMSSADENHLKAMLILLQ